MPSQDKKKNQPPTSSIKLNRPVRDFADEHENEAKSLAKRLQQAAMDIQNKKKK